MENVFRYRMPAGIPGHAARIQASIIEAAIASTAHPPTVYGAPVAIDQAQLPAGRIRPLREGDTAADIYGLLVRPYPTQQAGEGAPISGLCNVLVRGYLNVKLNGAAAPEKNGAVYVRVAKPTDDQPIGGIEAAPDGEHTIQLVDAHFMGEADANGLTEIAYKI